MSRPLVSVLMTSYNREQYIAEAIQSVLNSTYKDFELIIVDDGSKDRTVEIARRFEANDERVKVYINPHNLGDYPNRNKAASYAKGKYLKYVDSDDLIYPHGLEIFVNYMEQCPDAAVGFSCRYAQLQKPFPVQMDPSESFRAHFFKFGFLDTGPVAVIIRRDIFQKENGFSGINMTGDSELWMRLAQKYPVVVLPGGLVHWREHDGQQFQEGLRKDTYLQQNLSLIRTVIENAGNNLTENEKEKILKTYKKGTVRAIAKKGLKTARVAYYIKFYRQLGLGFSDLQHLVFR